VTHRAEQIMAAVQTTVTGLTTTGTRVDRGRAEEFPVENTPSLRVHMGNDTIVDPWTQALVDSDLEVFVDAHAYSVASNIETLLNLIREEVTKGLLLNDTLGLAFVQTIYEMGADRPELQGDLAKPAGRMTINFRVRYRRSRTDPGA
jgi:hypothetical protein